MIKCFVIDDEFLTVEVLKIILIKAHYFNFRVLLPTGKMAGND